jgi:hypothetical protein
LDLEDELVKELDNLDGVRSGTGATAVVVGSDGPGEVRAVVARVGVFAVPAGRKVDLGSETVRAVVLPVSAFVLYSSMIV